MRLVDAEQIGLTDMEIIMCDGNYKKALEMLIDKIANAPTVEVPQKMRGKWIEREVTHIDELEAKDIITAWQSCKCSVCGRYDTRPYMYYFDEPKYCSYCGADMRGDLDGYNVT